MGGIIRRGRKDPADATVGNLVGDEDMNSRGLVSSLYRLVPSDSAMSREESERRLKVKLRRLVAQYGESDVIKRIRMYPVSKNLEATKAWVLLTAFALPTRHREGS